MPTLPTNDPTPVTIQKQIADLQRQVRLLQQRAEAEDNPTQKPTRIVFSYAGPPVANNESGAYLISDFSATIHRLDFTAGVAGSTKTTAKIKVNGTVEYVFEIDPQVDVQTFTDLAIDVEEWDRVTMVCTEVGTDLSSVVFTMMSMAVEGDEYT